ncbi:MAG: hypothetical protein EB828_04580 [Nitrosopumilus sp. D6]|nr:MAG: hypothetical protein EB828_04580 [Nitrosopumilus sp. D6]
MSLFEVTPEILQGLNPSKAVNLVRQLIWADAYASGIEPSKINIPAEINIPDGGIDAEVSNAQKDGKYGIIKNGTTAYQIKSGNFTNNASGIKQILLKENSNELKDRIKSCLDKNGTLVIVFTGWDNPDSTDGQLETNFKEQLITVSKQYENAKIQIWRQNTILGFLEILPSLRLYVLDTPLGVFHFHEEWSKFADMVPKTHLGEQQHSFIQNVQKELRKNDEPVHLRIIGEPGIGKTRLVLEATKVDDLKPHVIYCENPEMLEKQNFRSQISLSDNKSNIILVIDECDYNHQTRLWNMLKHKSPAIKLITIFNEPDEFNADTKLDLPELHDVEIGKILESYIRGGNSLDQWIEMCRPSPRAAHIVGENLKLHPEEILRSPDTVPVWDRYIAGSILSGTEEFKNRKTVMLWLSLFKRFGFEGNFKNEGDKIAEIIQAAESNITPAVFRRTVQKLKEMRILQGSSTLYITPKVLHIYYWARWWKEYGKDFAPKIMSSLTGDDSQVLLGWYCSMFEYAKQSSQASKVVRELLSPGGLFENNETLRTRLGADFFLTLSKTDPSSALDCLERTIKKQSREDLLEFTTGRRGVVRALERMAMFKEYFERAAALLLLLAEAENEIYANNATGVFCDLFVPGSGRAAHTKVSPKNRIPALNLVMMSDSAHKRNVGIKACSLALQKTHISIMTSNFDVFDKHPKLWTKESDMEVIEYYQSILDLLVRQDGDKNQSEIGKIILDSLRYLILIPGLDAKVLEMIKKLYADDHLDGEKLIKTIIGILDLEKNSLNPDILKTLHAIQDDITGTDFHSLMRRYVGMDILINYSTGDNVDPRKIEIDGLVARALDPKNLKPELDWLVTDEAKYGYVFGYNLAKKDKNHLLLQIIMDALKINKKASGFFIEGYMRHVFESDPQKYEDTLDEIYADPALCRILPEIMCRSKMTDATAEKISHGINEGKFHRTVLKMFMFGSVTVNLSEDVILGWIRLLTNGNDVTETSIAMNLFHSYFIHHKQRPLPKQETLGLLLHKTLTCEQSVTLHDVVASHYWKETALEFTRQYPDDSLKIAKIVIENMGQDNFFNYSRSDIFEVLNEITRIRPRKTWNIISPCLGPPIDERAFAIQKWLQGEARLREGVLPVIPTDEVITWIEQDKDTRAGYAAKFLPAKFETVREFLTRYGDQEQVHRQLAINFNNEAWSGSAITHYVEKKKKFEKLKEKESDKNVLSWLDYYIKSIKGDIERSQEIEERELAILK